MKPRPPSRGFGKNVTENLSVVPSNKSSPPVSGSLILDGTSFRNVPGEDGESRQPSRRASSRQRQKSPFRSTSSVMKRGISATEITFNEHFQQQLQRSEDLKHQNRGGQSWALKKGPSTTKQALNKETARPESENVNRGLKHTQSESLSAYERPKSETPHSEHSIRVQSRHSAVSRKSCIMSKETASDEPRQPRTPKRVKFVTQGEETNMEVVPKRPDDNQEHNRTNDSRISSSEHHSEVIECVNVGERTYDHNGRPTNREKAAVFPVSFSVHELDRLKQRVIPGFMQMDNNSSTRQNHHHHHVFTTTDTGITISGLQRIDAELGNISLSPDSSEDKVSESTQLSDNQVNIDGKREPENDQLNDLNDSPPQLSDTDDDDNDDKDIDDNGEEEGCNSEKDQCTDIEDSTQDEGFYKVLKAVDRDSYSGYEHKKIRKASGSSSSRARGEHAKAHFVKVKFGESV